MSFDFSAAPLVYNGTKSRARASIIPVFPGNNCEYDIGARLPSRRELWPRRSSSTI